MYCPHCSYDQQAAPYTQPWDRMTCERCGRAYYAEQWLDESLEEMGDPVAEWQASSKRKDPPNGGTEMDNDAVQLVPDGADEPEHCVFISHNRADKSFAREIGKFLRHKGVEVWFDEWDIYGGDSIIDKLEEGIEKSDYFALVVSPSAMKSNWVRQEIRAAISRRVQAENTTIIPLVVSPVPEMPPFLTDWRRIDFTDLKRVPSPYDDLLHAIFRPDLKPKLGKRPSF